MDSKYDALMKVRTRSGQLLPEALVQEIHLRHLIDMYIHDMDNVFREVEDHYMRTEVVPILQVYSDDRIFAGVVASVKDTMRGRMVEDQNLQVIPYLDEMFKIALSERLDLAVANPNRFFVYQEPQ